MYCGKNTTISKRGREHNEKISALATLISQGKQSIFNTAEAATTLLIIKPTPFPHYQDFECQIFLRDLSNVIENI